MTGVGGYQRDLWKTSCKGTLWPSHKKDTESAWDAFETHHDGCEEHVQSVDSPCNTVFPTERHSPSAHMAAYCDRGTHVETDLMDLRAMSTGTEAASRASNLNSAMVSIANESQKQKEAKQQERTASESLSYTSFESETVAAQFSLARLLITAVGETNDKLSFGTRLPTATDLSGGLGRVAEDMRWSEAIENDYIVQLLRAQMREYEHVLSSM